MSHFNRLIISGLLSVASIVFFVILLFVITIVFLFFLVLNVAFQ
jgi:hypothetical protein